MSDKKHIDRLFQEGFKDFEATPSDDVWKNIEAKLNEKKKKRRIIPIWWRYAGVAAALLLLLTIGGLVFNKSDDGTNQQIVDIENALPNNNEVNKNTESKTVVSNHDTNETSANTNEASSHQNKVIVNKIKPSKESTIANTASASNNASKTKPVSTNKLGSNQNIAVSNKSIANHASKEINSIKKVSKNTKTPVNSVNSSETKNIASNSEKPVQGKANADNIINSHVKNHTALADSDNQKQEEAKADKTAENNKLSIEDALDNNPVAVENDTKLTNRWSVSPNAAPVYFNTLREGSSIDPQFNSNSKSGEINMSYGISASYALNKKISIRSGINRVNLSYNTNEIVAFQSLGFSSGSSALQNINSVSNNNDANNVSVISSESLKSAAPAAANASINQALGYIEIPLEIQYTLSDKKLGVNLIGGFSSFFLNNNEIFSEHENGTRTYLGNANNINDISYSANFGLGLNYKVSEKFDLNLEPMFKYQFNTFNNTSGEFTPFFIGVYTGFAIKF